jgi:predicted nucleic acid-binding Zn ribbon protein
MTSSVLTQKPNCEQEKCAVKRIVSGGTGLIFKGSGFYLTDYKNKDKTEQPKDKKEKKEKPKTDTKKNEKETAV